MKRRILNGMFCWANTAFCSYMAINSIRDGSDMLAAVLIANALFAAQQAFNYSHPRA